MAANERFYLTGLGLLMKDTAFTNKEESILRWLCSAAQISDATYWDTIQSIVPGSLEWYGVEQLKSTLRALGKEKILQAHYDRANRVYR